MRNLLVGGLAGFGVACVDSKSRGLGVDGVKEAEARNSLGNFRERSELNATAMSPFFCLLLGFLVSVASAEQRRLSPGRNAPLRKGCQGQPTLAGSPLEANCC